MGQMSEDDRAIRDIVAAVLMAGIQTMTAGARAARAFGEAEVYMAERAIWRTREEARWAKGAEKPVATRGGPTITPNEAGFPTPWRMHLRDGLPTMVDAQGDTIFAFVSQPPKIEALLEWIVEKVNQCAD